MTLIPDPPPRRSRLTVIIVAVGALAILGAAIAITYAFARHGGSPAPTASVPAVANIPQPNPKCTPAPGRKLGAGDDLARLQWFGWLDGKQTDMPAGQALMLRINGHHLVDAWYCPPRSEW